MNDLVLEQKLDLKCWIILADLYIYSQVDYILAILTHAKENNTITAKSLADNLFAKHLTISKKLLEICKEDGLLENSSNSMDYILTGKGSKAVEYGLVPQHEKSTWQIYHTSNPLVPDKYKIQKINRHDDKPEDGNFSSWPPDVKLDENIKKLENTDILPTFGDNTYPIHINEIMESGRPLSSTMDVKLQWRINENGSKLYLIKLGDNNLKDNRRLVAKSFNRLGVKETNSLKEIEKKFRSLVLSKKNSEKKKELTKDIETIRKHYDHFQELHRPSNNKISLQLPESIPEYDNVWRIILSEIDGEWDEERHKLLVPFNYLDPAELNTMKRKLSDLISIENFGSFNLKDTSVDIYPSTRYDAEEWAEHSLKQSMTSYQTRKKFADISDKIRKKFPDYDVKIQDRIYYVPDEKTPLFWYIQAMEDWDL